MQELARDAAEKASIYEELQAHDIPELRARLNVTDAGAALAPAPISRIPLQSGAILPMPLPFVFGVLNTAQAALVPATALSGIAQYQGFGSERQHPPPPHLVPKTGAERMAQCRAQAKRVLEEAPPAQRQMQLEVKRALGSEKRAKQRAARRASAAQLPAQVSH